jgi:hypothetical protein
MMKIKELSGGKTIGVAPEQAAMPLRGNAPRLRAGHPGTIEGNVNMAKQFAQCAKLQIGAPEALLAKVIFREIDGVMHLVVVPVKETGPDVYEVKYEGGKTKVPVIRLLRPLFASAQVAMRTDVWYDMPSEIVKDSEHGYGVSGVWTNAVITPRADSERDAAEESTASGPPEATGGAAAGLQEE